MFKYYKPEHLIGYYKVDLWFDLYHNKHLHNLSYVKTNNILILHDIVNSRVIEKILQKTYVPRMEYYLTHDFLKI